MDKASNQEPNSIGCWSRTCVLCGATKPIQEFPFKARRCRDFHLHRAREYARRRYADPEIAARLRDRDRNRKRRPDVRARRTEYDGCRRSNLEQRERERQNARRYRERHAVEIRAYRRKQFAALRDEDPKVYFILSVELQRIKIGFTKNNPVTRLRAAQTGSADELRLLGWMARDRDLENAIHDRFAAIQVRDEWFKAAPELLSFIVHNAVHR